MSITFCRELPKIELHAHLNGSLSRETLKKLGCPDDSITEYQKLTQLIDKNDKTLDECFQLFDVAHNATNDQKSVYLATKSVIKDFADDNVIYLELRTTPREGSDMTKEQYIENVVQAVKDNHRDIIVKILLSLNRGHGRKDLEETIDLIIEMKDKYPELIKGVDLSGNPSVGDFPEDLFQKAKDNGLFRTIHCAEIKNDEEELHAHLNGSLSRETLKKLGCPDDSITEYQKLTQLIDKNDKTLDECFQLFDVAHNATNDQKSVYLATKSVIEDFADDNVIYLELRTTPREGTDMTKEQYIENVVKAVKDNHRDIIVKILLSLNRGHGRKDLEETMDLIIEMKEKYPELIKGVDLSGNPSVGDFPEDLFQKAKDNGLFRTIHCAEIKNDEEVAMILNHRPDRIGHATFLHPNYGGSQANWDLYCKLKIPTECCLTSNVVCGTSKSYENHHVQEWIKSDLPFCLNTDDKGVFDANLSDEFCHIGKNFYLSKKDLWDISFKAVDFSFATNEEKNTLKSKLESWKKKTNLI